MPTYPGVNYPRYPHQFDQQKDADIPLSGAELVLVSQNGLPRNVTLAQVAGTATNNRNVAHMQAQWVQGAIVVDGQFFWSYRAPYGGTIASLDAEAAIGTFSVAVQVNGANVGGLGSVFTNNVAKSVQATGANSFLPGDQISGVISGTTGEPTAAVLNLNVVWA